MAINFAAQIADFNNKGFNADQARTIVLIRQAAGALFRDFPDAFVLFGGATLVLFHNSVRHSNDLDLLLNENIPSSEAIIESLKNGLQAAIEALNIGPLQYEVKNGNQPELKIFVSDTAGTRLFQIDFSRMGSVLQSEIENHQIELDDEVLSNVKSASKEFLLLQKAEAFLQRRIIKARDGYDIHLLLARGARLNQALHDHLEDFLSGEFGADEIKARIDQLTIKQCQKELQPILPPDSYEELAKAEFKPLREAAETLYADWLE
jgi:predicted nucleotidyltransferase component of viral defense system